MKKQHILTVTIVCLIVIAGGIVFSACASIASAEQSSNGLEAQVGTAAAATVVQYMIETRVAEQSIAMAAEPDVEAQATQPPAPTATATPLPTATDVPTVAATAQSAPPNPTATPVPAASSGPTIRADQNTNCRSGPSTSYTLQTVFMKGSESTVEGMDSGKNWWYIVNPDDSNETCWVWEGSTTVVGDTSTLPVVQAPAVNYNTSNLWYGSNAYNGYYGNNWCGYPMYGYYGYYGSDYCGKKASCGWTNYCKQNKKWCNEIKWATCNPYVYCGCNTNYWNPCKKSNCPAVTQVNYKNYCKNYPMCCGDVDEDDLKGN